MDFISQVIVFLAASLTAAYFFVYRRGPKKGPLSRPLGSAETLLHNCYKEDYLLTSSRALGIKLKSGFYLSNDLVIQSLNHLKERHASLQVCIQEQGGEYWFVPFKDTSTVPYCEKEGYWVDAIENILCENSSFANQLLWKVIRLNSAENSGFIFFIFVIHHAIMDGLSMSRLMAEFTDILNDMATEKNISYQSESVHLLPPAEFYICKYKLIKILPQLMIKFLNSIPCKIQTFIVKRIMNSLLGKLESDKQEVIDIKQIFNIFKSEIPEKHPESSKTRIIPISLTEMETSRLLRKTKESGSTVYGTIVASASVALAEMIEELSGIPMTNFKSKPLNKTLTSVNLRRYFGGEIPDNHMGMYMSSGCKQNLEINFQNHNKSDLLKETARKFSVDIHQQLKDRNFLTNFAMAGPVLKNIVPEMKTLLQKAKENGAERPILVFNNYGKVETKQQHKQEGQEQPVTATSLFNVIAEHNFPLIGLFAINCVTINGRMCVGVLYYTHQTSARVAQQYATKLKTMLTCNL